jgi:hypothetical protein
MDVRVIVGEVDAAERDEIVKAVHGERAAACALRSRMITAG